MSIKAILFDLDGTLLPMDIDVFVKEYFGRLARHLAPYGYDPKLLVDTVWRGTAAMVKNDGGRTNEECFWSVFNSKFGEGGPERAELFDAFYNEEFDKVGASFPKNASAAPLIKELKKRGYRVILATNPIFPAIATKKRIAWAGLSADDFELITTYENSCHAKPNPDYYRDILSLCDLSAGECLMVGNDVEEDMVAAELGMQTYLVTDYLINRGGADVSVYPSGDLPGLLSLLEA